MSDRTPCESCISALRDHTDALPLTDFDHLGDFEGIGGRNERWRAPMKQPAPFDETRRQIVRTRHQAGAADHRVKLIQNGTRKIVIH